MTVKQAAEKLGWSQLFLREAIYQGKCDLGVCVQMPGSSRRCFQINERKVEEWINGKSQSQYGHGSD